MIRYIVDSFRDISSFMFLRIFKTKKKILSRFTDINALNRVYKHHIVSVDVENHMECFLILYFLTKSMESSLSVTKCNAFHYVTTPTMKSRLLFCIVFFFKPNLYTIIFMYKLVFNIQIIGSAFIRRQVTEYMVHNYTMTRTQATCTFWDK